MKKSATKKSLRLTTQTVRTLTGGELDLVVGGIIAPSGGHNLSCKSNACDTAI
jgi:hypothetical protein